MKVTTIFLAIFFSYGLVVGQKSQTKGQIYQEISAFNKTKKIAKDSIILVANDILNIKLHRFLDSLHNNKIDSIIVYSVALPGYESKPSDCTIGYFPTYTYILWKQYGETNIDKFEGRCQLNTIHIKSDSVFDFYDKNKVQIKNDTFMPRVQRQTSNNKKGGFTISIVDHEPKYTLYYDIGGAYKVFSFAESELEDKESLFHTDNLKLKTYHWWTLILKQIGQ